MKRYIHSAEGYVNDDKIDFIVIVDDARTFQLDQMPIVAGRVPFEDYDDYSAEELLGLDFTELRKIRTPYALDTLQTAINEIKQGYIDNQIPKDKQDNLYKLTDVQRMILHNFYKSRENSDVPDYEVDIPKLLDTIKACNVVYGPDIRPNQPEKNFAEVHNLPMQRVDYLNIVHDLKQEEFRCALKSANEKRLGVILYEFIHTVNSYKLQNFDFTIDGPIDIYIKLIPNYNEKYNVAIISFHDPLDSDFGADL